MSTARDPDTEPGEDDSFDALLKEAAHVSGPGVAAAGAGLRVGGVLLEGRLSVLRRIGEGGMGIVYEARDTQRGGSVALKTLSRLDAGNVYRLKNEFRSLADVSHPNLCHLHELFSEAGQWFFTMELIDGERFDRWLRPDSVLDEPRLRSALGQLADAIDAIHRVGKLHRDLKPSNVLLTPDGRLVVLDFGLAIDPELGGVGQTVMDDSVSGTPAYMAPEQAAGLPAVTASDAYALGVMLFEALTGKLPFDGRPGEMLAAKQHRAAPSVRALAPDAPVDLAELCARLLVRDPAQRAETAAVRSVLGERSKMRSGEGLVQRGSIHARAAERPSGEPSLLGRERELLALRDAYGASVAGKPVVLFVAGEAGMGKSALVGTFLDALRDEGRATVLAGRCYERENVPFKGFDSVVDELSRHLRKLSREDATALLPREAFALARVFPVLERVPVVAEAPKKNVTDPLECKRRALEAFGELLGRMRDRAPLVVFIDDIQWLDQDSERLMRALFVHPDPVPLLLICAHRSEGAAGNTLLSSVRTAASDSAALDTRTLEVGALDTRALASLAERMLPANHAKDAALRFADEARGSPFFVAELARAAALQDAGAALPSLETAIALHVAALDPGAQRLISLIALAGQPLSPALLVDAASLGDGHAHLDHLRSEQLVRVSINADGERKVECYHDKIREHLAGALGPLQVRELALALSRTLLAQHTPDPELLLRYLDLAGLPEQAAQHAARAGESALATLAFVRAAELFEYALEHGRFAAERAQALRVRRGDALSGAGYGRRAGEAYATAAQNAQGEPARALALKAGEAFLMSGDHVRGRASWRDAMRQVGLRLPEGMLSTLASGLWWRARVRLRGLRYVARCDHAPEVLRELESLRISTLCFVRTDQVLGMACCARWLLRALQAGHETEIARALTWDVLFTSSMKVSPARILEQIELCERLCRRTGDMLALRWLHQIQVSWLFSLGEPAKALAVGEQALAIFEQRPEVASPYDRAWVDYFRVACLFQLARIREAGELAEALLDDTVTRGDGTVSAAVAGVACLVLLAKDRPELAQRRIDDARARLQPDQINVQDLFVLSAWQAPGLYQGNARQTWIALGEHKRRFLASSQGRWMFRGFLDSLFCALAAEASRDAVDERERRLLVRQARAHAKRAAPDKSAAGISTAAVVACLNGDRGAAIAALRRYLGEPPTPLSAVLARYKLGTLLGGDQGTALIADAERALTEAGVVDPERFARALAPGLHLSEARALPASTNER